MMHYRKGNNVEAEIKKTDLPFKDCMSTKQDDFLWMQVKGGTKVANVMTYAKNALDKGTHRTLVWSGSGGGIVKTISCAEILKRSYPLYQVTRMCYTNVTEHWLPQMEGLEEIAVKRQIPCVHILMSLDAIDDSIAGLQKPDTDTEFWIYGRKSSRTKRKPNTHHGEEFTPPNRNSKHQKKQLKQPPLPQSPVKQDVDSSP